MTCRYDKAIMTNCCLLGTKRPAQCDERATGAAQSGPVHVTVNAPGAYVATLPILVRAQP
jgi:hypothetical protein